ncbi:REP-associated tyrosine transposase [Nitrosomonas marina]|uniref:Putative transposase n=1 Tax=Nitrosomonas marina TaxID=917 RepID=A0A1H8DZ92_9PROT|nr:transposase [Nitrosomonas marina]SEN12639.1 putative transposase [Nitrosomonas marina]
MNVSGEFVGCNNQRALHHWTVNLLKRQGNDLLTRHIGLLRTSVATVRKAHPFVVHGWVVLPDHLHCVIELPSNDMNFSTRWRLIKMGFSKGLPQEEIRNASRTRRGERGIWQRRYLGAFDSESA